MLLLCCEDAMILVVDVSYALNRASADLNHSVLLPPFGWPNFFPKPRNLTETEDAILSCMKHPVPLMSCLQQVNLQRHL